MFILKCEYVQLLNLLDAVSEAGYGKPNLTRANPVKAGDAKPPGFDAEFSVMLAGLPGRATEIAYPGYAPPFICYCNIKAITCLTATTPPLPS